MGRKLIVKVPLNGTAWYPGGSMKKNWFLHQFALILTHWIPAYFLDCVIYLAGHKPL
jgi:fatty acyl-CoA reductase